MKITIEHYEEKFTYESEHDVMGMTDLTEKLYGLCIAAGFHPDTVGECFFEKGREATEHLYPDDKGVSDPIQLESIVVKSLYGDERKFTILGMNCIEYSFKDDGHTGCSRNDDGWLESVDPSGGPYISVGTNLGNIHKGLKELTVMKIKRSDTKSGSYYLTVK
jgi:hypothetical protein